MHVASVVLAVRPWSIFGPAIMKSRMEDLYMDWALRCSDMSRAQRLKVGAVIVKNDNVIGFGWNGTPSGWDNLCEYEEYLKPNSESWLEDEYILEQWPFEDDKGRYSLVTKPEVLHAEMNALMKLAKSTESGLGASLFITHAPCIHCAKATYQAGIAEVIYKEVYRSEDGIEFLSKAGVQVKQIGTDRIYPV